MIRSPWSNKYDPAMEDGAMPSNTLRNLEVEANKAFDQYRELYFEGKTTECLSYFIATFSVLVDTFWTEFVLKFPFESYE